MTRGPRAHGNTMGSVVSELLQTHVHSINTSGKLVFGHIFWRNSVILFCERFIPKSAEVVLICDVSLRHVHTFTHMFIKF